MRQAWIVGTLCVCAGLGCGRGAVRTGPPPLATTEAPASQVVFEANRGQLREGVAFRARGAAGELWLSPDAVHFARGGAAVDMRLAGANSTPAVVGEQLAQARVHYLTGASPAGWVTDVATYARVRYRAVYPGIDVVFYGKGHELEYDFVLAPGADPAAIGLDFDSAAKVSVDPDGALVVAAAGAEVRQQRPIAYQESAQGRVPVDARFAPGPDGVVRFELGDYDRTRALVIDPVVTYSTFLGGSGLDIAMGIAADAAGSAYVVGHTRSTDLSVLSATQSTSGGGLDVFVAKYASNGALLFTTYLGGSNDDFGTAIAVHSNGTVYVVGHTASTNFPTSVGAYDSTGDAGEAFLAKLSANGSALVYGSYLGGSGMDQAHAVVVEANGNAVIAGSTNSTFAQGFPATTGAFKTDCVGFSCVDAYVVVMQPGATGSIAYGTYLGGMNGAEVARAVVLTAGGQIAVAGDTSASDFPITGTGFQNTLDTTSSRSDAFVSVLDRTETGSAQLTYSTFLGGRGADTAFSLAADATGLVVSGQAGVNATNPFPTKGTVVQPAHTPGDIFSDGFVARIDPAALTRAASLVWSTFLGGAGHDTVFAVRIDGSGRIWAAGLTTDNVLASGQACTGIAGECGGSLVCGPEIFPGSPRECRSGVGFPQWRPFNLLSQFSSTFVSRLSANADTFDFSASYGGRNGDVVIALALDGNGNAVIAGQTSANALSFPLVTAHHPTYGGAIDAVVARISPSDCDLEVSYAAMPPATVTQGTRLDYGILVSNVGTITCSARLLFRYTPTGIAAFGVSTQTVTTGAGFCSVRTGQVIECILHSIAGTPARVDIGLPTQRSVTAVGTAAVEGHWAFDGIRGNNQITATTTVSSATVDAGVATDGAVGVDGAVAVDGGTPGVDAATPAVDAATPTVDAATPATDAATPMVDAGKSGGGGGGCAVSTSAPATGGMLSLLGLALLGLVFRRRLRRRA